MFNVGKQLRTLTISKRESAALSRATFRRYGEDGHFTRVFDACRTPFSSSVCISKMAQEVPLPTSPVESPHGCRKGMFETEPGNVDDFGG